MSGSMRKASTHAASHGGGAMIPAAESTVQQASRSDTNRTRSGTVAYPSCALKEPVLTIRDGAPKPPAEFDTTEEYYIPQCDTGTPPENCYHMISFIKPLCMHAYPHGRAEPRLDRATSGRWPARIAASELTQRSMDRASRPQRGSRRSTTPYITCPTA